MVVAQRWHCDLLSPVSPALLTCPHMPSYFLTCPHTSLPQLRHGLEPYRREQAGTANKAVVKPVKVWFRAGMRLGVRVSPGSGNIDKGLWGMADRWQAWHTDVGGMQIARYLSMHEIQMSVARDIQYAT